MQNLLKNAHDGAEKITGRRLYIMLAVIFVVFMLVGFLGNYFISQFLKSPENGGAGNTTVTEPQKFTYEGLVTYVDPSTYPQDEINYVLNDSTGKRVILLKADDQKLEVSEGLFVKVTGEKQTTVDGNAEVLLVEKVSISAK